MLADGGRARDRARRRRRALRAHLGRREPRRQRHRERRRAAAAHDHPRARRARAERARSRSARTASEIAASLERILREAAPAGAEVELERRAPASRPASTRPIPRSGWRATAIGRAAGSRPLFVRTGGSIPILGGLAERGIPTVLSGFALDADGIHGPDESYRLESLELGERAARELYAALARCAAPCGASRAETWTRQSRVGGERGVHALARDQLDAVGGRLDHRRRDPRRARTARAPSRRGRGGRPARWRPMPQRTRGRSRACRGARRPSAGRCGRPARRPAWRAPGRTRASTSSCTQTTCSGARP